MKALYVPILPLKAWQHLFHQHILPMDRGSHLCLKHRYLLFFSSFQVFSDPIQILLTLSKEKYNEVQKCYIFNKIILEYNFLFLLVTTVCG